MSDVDVQEQLNARIEGYARDQIFARADVACELLSTLIERDGGCREHGGVLTLKGMALAQSDLPQVVAQATNLVTAIYEEGTLLSTSAATQLAGSELPAEILATTKLRGEFFMGTETFGDRSYAVAARPLMVDGVARGTVVAGQVATESSTALLGLSAIQQEIIDLADHLQRDRQQTVTDFVKTIRSIAKRVHLLALNASILSAQAGEHGRGFAVVAREIGELAERTRQSTQELEQQILGTGPAVRVERRHPGRR